MNKPLTLLAISSSLWTLPFHSYPVTYVLEFKQNLPGQLYALLIHVFDGNDVSLRWGWKEKKE